MTSLDKENNKHKDPEFVSEKDIYVDRLDVASAHEEDLQNIDHPYTDTKESDVTHMLKMDVNELFDSKKESSYVLQKDQEFFSYDVEYDNNESDDESHKETVPHEDHSLDEHNVYHHAEQEDNTKQKLNTNHQQEKQNTIFPNWNGGIDQHIQFLESALREVVLHIEDKDKDTTEKMHLLQEKLQELEEEKRRLDSELQRNNQENHLKNVHIRKDMQLDGMSENYEETNVQKSVEKSSQNPEDGFIENQMQELYEKEQKIPLNLSEEIAQQIEQSFARQNVKQKDIEDLKNTFTNSKKNKHSDLSLKSPEKEQKYNRVKETEEHAKEFLSHSHDGHANQHFLNVSKSVEERIDALGVELQKLHEKHNQDHLINTLEKRFTELAKDIQAPSSRSVEFDEMRGQISSLNNSIEQLKEKILYDNFSGELGERSGTSLPMNDEISQQIDELKNELSENEQRNGQLLDMMQKTVERVVDKLNEQPSQLDVSQEFFSSPVQQQPQNALHETFSSQAEPSFVPQNSSNPAYKPFPENQTHLRQNSVMGSTQASQGQGQALSPTMPQNQASQVGKTINSDRVGSIGRGSIRTQVHDTNQDVKNDSKVLGIIGAITSKFKKGPAKTMAIVFVFAFSSYSFYHYVKDDMINDKIIVSNYIGNNDDNVITSSINSFENNKNIAHRSDSYTHKSQSSIILPTPGETKSTFGPVKDSLSTSSKSYTKTKIFDDEQEKANVSRSLGKESSMSGLEKMAEAGDAFAQYALAESYVKETTDRHTHKAIEYFDKAAKTGLPPAQYRLGLIYEKGDLVPQDLDKAFQLYSQAAKKGNIYAMHNLGVLLTEKEDSQDADFVKAAHWFQKAAEFGFKDSQYNLAILYERGLGVKRDVVKAYMWYAIAASKGDAEAATKRDGLARQLNNESLNDAGRMIIAYKPQKPLSYANKVEVNEKIHEYRVKTHTNFQKNNRTIREVQMLLFSLGYDVGIIDGINGNKTINAIKLFQRENGYAQTGKITKKLVKDLIFESSK